ncbi:MAG: monofunctional biosynthetic peptidoglycan transglycosylase [Prevotella sp.]|nr:monofunctional biosynthetic peptidoglycan transglycosylase [Prevotella sp.]
MLVIRKILKCVKWLVVFFFTSTILSVILYRFVPVFATPLMVIRCVQQVANGDKLTWHHSWTSLEHMSPHLPIAVMASEDQRFLTHHGFDVEAIKKAIEYNETHEKKRGASTISQQTAKNVFLWPGRSWLRKGLEAYFTFLIELFWSKERIMEVYLNSIEMGPGIYGAEAVAEQHFNKSAAVLTREDCALIAATLPKPLEYSSKTPSAYMLKRQRQILRQMKNIPRFP